MGAQLFLKEQKEWENVPRNAIVELAKATKSKIKKAAQIPASGFDSSKKLDNSYYIKL